MGCVPRGFTGREDALRLETSAAAARGLGKSCKGEIIKCNSQEGHKKCFVIFLLCFCFGDKEKCVCVCFLSYNSLIMVKGDKYFVFLQGEKEKQ